MKKVMTLLVLTLMMACAGPILTPSPTLSPSPIATIVATPDERILLRLYLEEARIIIDKFKRADDALIEEMGLKGNARAIVGDSSEAGAAIAKELRPDQSEADITLEGAQSLQRFAIRERPLLLEFQSEWKTLLPPAMAQGYHAQVQVAIEKQLDANMEIEWTSADVKDEFLEAFSYRVSAVYLFEEAERKFQTLWQIATEAEK